MVCRRMVSLVAMLFALGTAAACGEPEGEKQPDVNAETSALTQHAAAFICKAPVGGAAFHCPQAGCCLLKNNYTSPPSYSCYDCR